MLTVIPEVKFCFFPHSRKQSPVYRQLPPLIFDPLSPNGDQRQFSPNNIHTLSREMRI